MSLQRGKYNDYKVGHHRRKPLTYTIDNITGCWIWQGSRGGGQGEYGSIYKDGKSVLAHRFFYEEKHGKISEGLELDHLCKNKRCCNPDHMEAVPHVINMRRSKTTKLTEEDVLYIRNSQETNVILALLYNVSESHISRIKNKVKWRKTTVEELKAKVRD